MLTVGLHTSRRVRCSVLAILLFWSLSKPLALLGISCYQQFVSPYKGWRCAYAALHGGSPCSVYARQTISDQGILGGSVLLWHRFGECRSAALAVAANSSSDKIGKECADACQKSERDCAEGCVRGCSGGVPQTAPNAPARPRPPSTFIQPCPDAGGYRGFGWVDPENSGRIHLGHDYNAPAETQVRAIAEGIVVDVNLNVGGFGGSNPTKSGPLMWIRHRTSTGEYFHALYGHIRPCKRKNQRVDAGEIVGTIIPFYDGSDYIPHLHLGIWQGKGALPSQALGYGPQRNFVSPIEFMNTHQPGSLGR